MLQLNKMNMKQVKFFLSAALVVILISVTGCQKYPEGPLVSLRTKTERVANQWKVAQALDNGSDVTSSYNMFELRLTKKGGATLSIKYTALGATLEYTTEGQWSFVNNKEKISFDYDNNDADRVYRILKLEEEEMWLKEDNGNIELHFVSK